MLRQIAGRVTTLTKRVAGLPMNAFDLLRADHMKVERIALELRLSRERDKRIRLLSQLNQVLSEHMRLEEEFLYPACAQVKGLSGLIDHAHADHQLFKNVLKDLAIMDPKTGQFNGLLTKAIVEVERHVHEEENTIFARARRSMSKTDFHRMNRQIIDAHGVPEVEKPQAA